VQLPFSYRYFPIKPEFAYASEKGIANKRAWDSYNSNGSQRT